MYLFPLKVTSIYDLICYFRFGFVFRFFTQTTILSNFFRRFKQLPSHEVNCSSECQPTPVSQLSYSDRLVNSSDFSRLSGRTVRLFTRADFTYCPQLTHDFARTDTAEIMANNSPRLLTSGRACEGSSSTHYMSKNPHSPYCRRRVRNETAKCDRDSEWNDRYSMMVAQ